MTMLPKPRDQKKKAVKRQKRNIQQRKQKFSQLPLFLAQLKWKIAVKHNTAAVLMAFLLLKVNSSKVVIYSMKIVISPSINVARTVKLQVILPLFLLQNIN